MVTKTKTTKKPAAPRRKTGPAFSAAARLIEQRRVEEEILAMARRYVFELETLETRRLDGLDFHEVSVWGLREALLAAYAAGKAAR